MSNTNLISIERIEKAIYLIRGEKVMLDRYLAQLYGVETKVLNRAVKRNLQRFPLDFMFQLTAEEADILRCQIGTSSWKHGGRRYLPYVFTEQGVAMLSTVQHPPFSTYIFDQLGCFQILNEHAEEFSNALSRDLECFGGRVNQKGTFLG